MAFEDEPYRFAPEKGSWEEDFFLAIAMMIGNGEIASDLELLQGIMIEAKAHQLKASDIYSDATLAAALQEIAGADAETNLGANRLVKPDIAALKQFLEDTQVTTPNA